MTEPRETPRAPGVAAGRRVEPQASRNRKSGPAGAPPDAHGAGADQAEPECALRADLARRAHPSFANPRLCSRKA